MPKFTDAISYLGQLKMKGNLNISLYTTCLLMQKVDSSVSLLMRQVKNSPHPKGKHFHTVCPKLQCFPQEIMYAEDL